VQYYYNGGYSSYASRTPHVEGQQCYNWEMKDAASGNVVKIYNAGAIRCAFYALPDCSLKGLWKDYYTFDNPRDGFVKRAAEWSRGLMKFCVQPNRSALTLH